MTHQDLKDFLDEKVVLYNNPKFIEADPIQIPHQFSKKEDIEIAAFLTATISWGNRKMIIQNASKMMELLDYHPYDFVMNHQENDLKSFENFGGLVFGCGAILHSIFRVFSKKSKNLFKVGYHFSHERLCLTL